jgi:hypothetical protein
MCELDSTARLTRGMPGGCSDVLSGLLGLRQVEPEEEELEAQTCSWCGSPASLRCSRCKSTWYCCKEHQRMHWREHKITCI